MRYESGQELMKTLDKDEVAVKVVVRRQSSIGVSRQLPKIHMTPEEH